jgi:WD40 repeat protein
MGKLWDIASGALLRNVPGHVVAGQKVVLAVDWPEDGTLTASDLDSGRVLYRLPETYNVVAASSAPHAIVAGSSGALRVLEVATGKLGDVLTTYKIVPGYDFNCGAISADGQRAATLEGEKRLELWDLRTQKLLRRFDVDLDGGCELSFSASGQELHYRISDRYRLISAKDGAVLVKLEGVLAMAADGGYAALKDADGLSVVALPSGKRVAALPLAAEVAAFSASGSELVVADEGHTLRLYRIPEGKEVQRVQLGDNSVSFPKFVPGERRLMFLGVEPGASDLATKRDLIWELDGNRVRPLSRVAAEAAQSIAVSRDGTRLLVANANRSIALWDLTNFGMLRSYALPKIAGIQAVALADDGERALVGTYNGEVRVVALASGATLSSVNVPGTVVDLALLPGDERAIVCDEDGGVSLIDVRAGRSLSRAETDGAALFRVCAVAANGKLAVAGSRALSLVDAASGAALKKLDALELAAEGAALSPDLRHAVTVGLSNGPLVLDLTSGRTVREMHALPDEGVSGDVVAFAPDGKTVFVGRDREIRSFDFATGKLVRQLGAHSDDIVDISVSSDGKQLISAAKDGTVRVENLANGSAVQLVSSADQWIAYTDDGYFDMSRRGGELVAVVDAGRPYRIDQIAAHSNRPDVILTRMGAGTPEVLAHAKARRARRLAKLGVSSTAALSRFADAPRAAIVSLESRPGAAKTALLEGRLEGVRNPLAHYNVYVNDVPLFKAPGKPSGGQNAQIREQIELTPGRNKVELSVRDAAGVESLRSFRYLEYTPPTSAPRGDLYVVTFGVSRYKDKRLNLRFAHKDALDLAYVAGKLSGFGKVHVKTYVDEQVTVDALTKAAEFTKRAGVDDTLIVFAAGHGAYSRDAEARYHFVTHETDPARLHETAAPFEAIEALLYESAARKKLLLLDTCESGERDAEASSSGNAAGARGLRSRAARGLVLAPDTDSRGGRARPRSFPPEQDRYSDGDLLRRSGAIVLSSSRGSEASFELEELGNGAFTSALLSAFTSSDADANADGLLDTDELRSSVGRRVATLTGDRQHPTVDRDNLEVAITFVPAVGVVPAERR